MDLIGTPNCPNVTPFTLKSPRNLTAMRENGFCKDQSIKRWKEGNKMKSIRHIRRFFLHHQKRVWGEGSACSALERKVISLDRWKKLVVKIKNKNHSLLLLLLFLSFRRKGTAQYSLDLLIWPPSPLPPPLCKRASVFARFLHYSGGLSVVAKPFANRVAAFPPYTSHPLFPAPKTNNKHRALDHWPRLWWACCTGQILAENRKQV